MITIGGNSYEGFTSLLHFLFIFVFSCESDDDDDPKVPNFKTYESLYSGPINDDNQMIGITSITIFEGDIYGISEGEGFRFINIGEYDNLSSMLSVNGTDKTGQEDELLIFSGNISNDTITGTWETDDDQGDYSLLKVYDDIDGSYYGFAYKGNNIEKYILLMIIDNEIIGHDYIREDDVIASGQVNPITRSIQGTGFGFNEDQERFDITFTGTLSENKITGTWSEDGTEKGTFECFRIESN